MNRFLISAVAGLLTLADAHAQFLPTNAAGLCEIAEVGLADSISKEILFANSKRWMHHLNQEEGKVNSAVIDSIAAKISGDFEFPVYSQSGILRKMTGSISYHFSIEAKDGKYRFSFNDFVYHYYVQDRNYKLVKNGRTKPLEEVEAVGWQKLWTEHRRTAYSKVSGQIEDLKARIIETPKATDKPKGKNKVDW